MRNFETIQFEVDGRDIMFICDSNDTRNGFSHNCSLIIDRDEKSWTSVHYLNRTWESWTYQTACLNACEKALEIEHDRFIWTFKNTVGVSRLVGKRKDVAEELFNELAYVKLLNEVKHVLKTRVF